MFYLDYGCFKLRKIYDSKRGQWIKPWVPKGMKKYPGFCDLCAKMSQDIEYHMYYSSLLSVFPITNEFF